MKSEVIHRKISVIMFHIINIISFLLGLAPCSVKISPQSTQKRGLTLKFSYSRVGCAYNVLLIILCAGIIMPAVLQLDDSLFPDHSKTIKVITVTVFMIGNSSVIVIIIFYSILQGNIVNIGNRLHEFDQKYGDKFIGKHVNMLGDFKKFMTIMLMLVFWNGAFSTTLIEGHEDFLVATTLCVCFTSWFLIQYSLNINILKDRFEGLNNALLTVARRPIMLKGNSLFQRTVSNGRLIVENLIVFRQARNEVYQVSCEVSCFYSFPVVLVIFYCCCVSIDSIYFNIVTNSTSIVSIFWTFVAMYPVIMLSASVNTFNAEADRTANIVYDIMTTYGPNRDIEFELNNFAIELLHKKVSFNACGMFQLDCTLLYSLFGMIVTYLLILVQFKPANSDTKN